MNRNDAVSAKALKLGIALAFGAALLSSQASRAEDLTVAVSLGPLGETLKKAVLAPFKEQSKLDVAVDDRDAGIGAVRTKLEGGGNTWDVVAAEDIEVLQGCDEGFFAKIDRSKLPNLKDYNIADPRFECGIPYVVYNTALGYDKNVVKTEPTSWADLWDTQKWPGKRAMAKSPVDALEIALLADGVAGADVYSVLATPEGVDRAFKKLDALKKDIVWWTNVGQSRQMLASGEVVMTVTFDNGIRFFNKTQKTNLGAVLKDAITHVDYWAIIAESPQIDNAYKFLEYASQPEPQAAVTNMLAISVPNRNALPLTSDDIRPFVSTDPENLKSTFKSDADFWINNYDALAKRFDTWVAGQ